MRHGSHPVTKTESLSVTSSYNGSNAVYRILRDSSWGPALMNLGWFTFRGPLGFMNLTTNLCDLQRSLAYRSIDLMRVQPEQEVLDIACGRGMTSFMIRRMHPRSSVVGMDLLPENTQIGQTLFGNQPGLRYQQGDATALPFADGSFDRIHCLEAAFHFPNRDRFLHESGRVLREGGRMVVVDFTWKDAKFRETRMSPAGQVVREIWQWEDLFTLEDYRRYAAEGGLTMVEDYDWTRRVSTPNTRLLESLVWLRRRGWGRRSMEYMNPLLRSVMEHDWKELEEAAQAHRKMEPYCVYTTMVFEKRTAS